jgi:dTMP kinase
MYLSDYPGLLLVFEGIDGAGKTTQVHLLRQALEQAGLDVVVSKEPTDGPWGQVIRKSAATGRLPLDEELHAFVEDRKEHVQALIGPALKAGKVVILDRYYYSTMAYQGQRGADVEAIRKAMQEIAPAPDVVFLLDVDPAVSLVRISDSRGDVPNAFEKAESLAAVRTLFNRIAHTDERILKLDGSLPVDVIHATITRLLVDGPLRAKCAPHEGSSSRPGERRTLAQCDWHTLRSALLEALPKRYDTAHALLSKPAA